MIIKPAMDLMDSRPVRLSQGRFDESVTYEGDPVEAIMAFEEAGAECAHIVDLDGARAGAPRQHGLLADIALSVGIALQVAGGFREEQQLSRMFDAGVDKVAIGSLCVKEPETVRGFLARFGAERITLALDVHVEDGTPYVATNGWTQSSRRTLWDVAGDFPDATHFLITDIGRDGMLGGPNLDLVREFCRRRPQALIHASGGIGTLDDIVALDQAGASRAVIGKALWEGRFTLAEALGRGHP